MNVLRICTHAAKMLLVLTLWVPTHVNAEVAIPVMVAFAQVNDLLSWQAFMSSVELEYKQELLNALEKEQ